MYKKLTIFILFFSFLVILISCGQLIPPTNDKPIFTDPLVKIDLVSNPNFVIQLISDAVFIDQRCANHLTQINMGYWSGSGNRDGLIHLLNQISYSSFPWPEIPVWDEGISTSNNFPSYKLMNQEYWYERANAVEGRVTINEIVYIDPHPVTFTQADEIWGQYSTRYAEMARDFYRYTQRIPKAWCFVQGAKANRIFYKYELPALRILEKEKMVKVYFAQSKTADWHNPADWKEGTENAPTPITEQGLAPKLSGTNLVENAYQVATAYRDGYYGKQDTKAKKLAITALKNQIIGLDESEYEEAFAKALYLTAF